MIPPVIKTAFYKVFLPGILLTAGCLRPSSISTVYVIFGLIFPLLPSIKQSTVVPRSVRISIILVLVFSVIATLAQVAYQWIEARESETEYIKRCKKDKMTKVLRTIGFEKLASQELPTHPEASRVFLPEILSLIASILTAIIVLSIRHTRRASATSFEGAVQVVRDQRQNAQMNTPWMSSALGDTLRRASNMFIVVFIGVVSCIQPSLLSIPYFIIFLFVLTWYSMHRSIQHEGFNRIKLITIAYTVIHFLLIFLYQIPGAQHAFDKKLANGTWNELAFTKKWAPLIGLSPIMRSDCNEWYNFQVGGLEWPLYVNPLAILALFQIVIWQYSFTKHGTHRFTRASEDPRDDGSSVHEEFLQRQSAGSTAFDRQLLAIESDEESREEAGGDGMRLRKITSQFMDRQRISQIFRGPRAKKSAASRGLIMLVSFFFSQAYVLGLIALMTWAMLYHSIFGLTLLMLACIIWIFPDSRRAAFKFAPVLVAYIEILLCIQYVYSMQWDASWTHSGSWISGLKNWIMILGMEPAANRVAAFVAMLAKLFLSLPICLILRLSRRDKKFESLNEAEKARRLANYGTFASISAMEQQPGPITDTPRESSGSEAPPHGIQRVIGWLSSILVAIWLPVVFLVIVVAATWSKASFFTIGYFAFFSGSILLFKSSFSAFRHLYFIVFTLLTAYTSLVIILTYVYQFDYVNERVENISRDYFHRPNLPEDIGLDKFLTGTSNTLFTNLAPSIALYIVTMLQLKFFHTQWKAMTEPSSRRADSGRQEGDQPGTSQQQAPRKKLNDKIGRVIGEAIDIIWKIAEVHISKLVFLLIVIIITTTTGSGGQDASVALYVPLLVLISLAVCLPRKASNLFSLLVCSYLSAYALCKMIFQLSFFNENMVTPFTDDDCVNNHTTTFLQWMGFRKDPNTFNLVKELIISILLLAIQSVVFYRRLYARAANGETRPDIGRGLVFPNQSPLLLDKDMASFCKWFADYAFYKFGVEVSIIFMAIHIWCRMDAIAVITSLFIIAIVLSPRPLIRVIWPILLIYLAIIFPLQYAMHVGLPPQECIKYPWDFNDRGLNALSMLFNLPRYDVSWAGYYFVADFLALVSVACQMYVFGEESDDHPAGNNKSIYVGHQFAILPDNPHYDFIAKQRSFVDYAKIFIFQYGHWVTLLMVLIAGLGGTSLFALGYMVLSLSMLWEGNNLYLMKNHKLTLYRWKLVLAYTSVVIMLKTALQLVGCSVNMSDNSGLCIVRQLFAIQCVAQNVKINDLAVSTGTCDVKDAEANIGYDTFALGFIIFQIRVLCSWYFQYAITEFRSEIVLANRGAVLSNQLIEKEMKEQEDQQSKKFDDIRRRTKAIRERYEKLQKDQDHADIVEPDTYGKDDMRGRHRLRPSLDSYEDDPLPSYNYRYSIDDDEDDFDHVEYVELAKRAGDYYMFDYDPEADELKKDKETFVPEVDPGASEFNKLDPTQLAYAAVSKDLNMKETLESAEEAEKRVEAGSDKKEEMMKNVVTPRTSTVGTSAQAGLDDDEIIEEDVTQEDESKVVYCGRFVIKMISNTLDWIAAFLNRRSREHRYVAFVLSKEKTRLKDKKGQSLNDVSRRLSDIHNDAKSERGLMVVQSESDIAKMEEAAINSWQKRNVLARLTNAIGYCIAAHTDVVCYVLAILCHARGAGVITLPLPLMVFFWGSLSSPRPSKFFWVSMILYTEAIIVIKFITQFGFWDFNKEPYQVTHSTDPYEIAKVLGVQKQEFYCGYEVTLLMALFFHRYMLRKLGLWKDANVSETFDGGDLTLSDIDRIQAGREGHINPTLDVSSSQSLESQSSERSTTGEPSGRSKRNSIDSKNGKASSTDAAQGSGEARHEAGQVVTTAAQEGDEVDGGEADKERIGISRFIYQLFYPKFRYIRDLYPSMFGLDIICFLIVVFGYSSFGDGGSGSVVADIQSNRVPLAFVLMMIISSFMIVIDRGLYLRKAIRCKLIYQFVIVIFMHAWIFFILPAVTKRSAISNSVAQALYIVKAIYLLVSAWQIRNGYPQLCVGNLLMHSYGMANMIFFKIFLAVPFLWELRTAIDWTWTDTSMPLFDYFNMEQFYSTIYNLKCNRTFENAYPAPRGEKKGVMVKYLMGLPFVIFIVLLIWLPLLAFSLLNKVGTNLPPEHVSLTVSMEGYPPLYTIEAQGRELKTLELKEFNDMRDRYAELTEKSLANQNDKSKLVDASRRAISTLDDYTYEDVMRVQFRPESQSPWQISGASLTALTSELDKMDFNASTSTLINLKMEFTRKREKREKEPVKHTVTFSTPVTKDMRDRLLESIKNAKGADNTIISHIFPKFVIVPNEGEVSAADALIRPANITVPKISDLYCGLNLRYQSDKVWTGQLRTDQYNGIYNLAPQPYPIEYTSPYTNGTGVLYYVEVIAMVDRVFPSLLSKFVSGGIVAMYLALVMLVGKVIRGVLTNSPMSVMITEIPNPDHLLKICLDIYLVREAKDFVLEQDLFAKLIFLFRSPATLIKWTRLRSKTKEE